MPQINPLEQTQTTPSPAVGGYAPRLPSRIPGLDGLRAISILMVIVGHLCWSHLTGGAILAHAGNYGVRVFFLISGFLITTLLLKEYDKTGSISLKNFYIRRSLRIFPAFYFFALTVYILFRLDLIKLLPGDLLHALTYTMNYHAQRAWFLNHIWSLSVEEQFYLLWPATLFLLGPRRGLWVAAAAILGAPLVRAVMYFGFHMSDTALSRQFQAICDALATGCFMAANYNRLSANQTYLRLSRSPAMLFIAGSLFLSPVAFFLIKAPWYYIVGQSLANVGGILFLDRCVRFPGDRVGKLLGWKPMRLIGMWSYSLYLWQELFIDPTGQGMGFHFPMDLLLTMAAAIGSFYLIEQQLLKFKGRFSAAG